MEFGMLNKAEQMRIEATEYAKSFIGTWYSWGGDDPMAGFDCSRYTGEIMKSVGVLPRNSVAPRARDQFKMWIKYQVVNPYKGCLVFWRSKEDGPVMHVEYCINEYQTIGASGGGGATVTKADAIRDNAFIKERPIHRNRPLAGFVDPFKLFEGSQ